MNDTIKVLTLFACAPLLGACQAHTTGDHSPTVPHSGQEEHQSPADGNLDGAELEEPDPQANVVKGDPPGYPAVMATWADPKGRPSSWRDSAIGLDDGILEACGIDAKYAYFSYDSAELSELAKDTIGKLSTCFTTGPLKGHGMVVVGHTDPQGTDKYNDELGKSRADSVAEQLVEVGMPKDKLTVKSEGEKEASDNPISWPSDRRVDISIAN